MDQREATVLRMRFGLDSHEPQTLKEIGEQLGLTRERVRQIETEALNKMADSWKTPATGWAKWSSGEARVARREMAGGRPVIRQLGASSDRLTDGAEVQNRLALGVYWVLHRGCRTRGERRRAKSLADHILRHVEFCARTGVPHFSCRSDWFCTARVARTPSSPVWIADGSAKCAEFTSVFGAQLEWRPSVAGVRGRETRAQRALTVG